MNETAGKENGKERHIFNEAAALERFSGDKAMLRSVIRAFLSDMEEHLARIRVCFSAGSDVSGVIIEAYNIMGSAGNIGAETMSGLAAKLDMAIRGGHKKHAFELAIRLEREFKELQKILRDSGWL